MQPDRLWTTTQIHTQHQSRAYWKMNVYQSTKPLVLRSTVAFARGTHTAARPTAQRLPLSCWPASTCRQQLHPPPLFLASIVISRSKHSSTQIKRLFKKNPAKRRIALTKARDQQESSSFGTAVDAAEANNDNNIPTARFAPIIDDPQFLPNGWSPPPAQDNEQVKEALQKYPFLVQRTRNKPQDAVGFLPVYSDFR